MTAIVKDSCPRLPPWKVTPPQQETINHPGQTIITQVEIPQKFSWQGRLACGEDRYSWPILKTPYLFCVLEGFASIEELQAAINDPESRFYQNIFEVPPTNRVFGVPHTCLLPQAITNLDQSSLQQLLGSLEGFFVYSASNENWDNIPRSSMITVADGDTLNAVDTFDSSQWLGGDYLEFEILNGAIFSTPYGSPIDATAELPNYLAATAQSFAQYAATFRNYQRVVFYYSSGFGPADSYDIDALQQMGAKVYVVPDTAGDSAFAEWMYGIMQTEITAFLQRISSS